MNYCADKQPSGPRYAHTQSNQVPAHPGTPIMLWVATRAAQRPPRNQVVLGVRPPSGAISTRPYNWLLGAPYTCSGGTSESGGWVHGCWGQCHERAHPSNTF